ncbi:tuftelin 1b [Kryptolebias marmoratus]|uniref:Tuftelin-like n=1 Tax=Kryptolebias marmoratus TaxID=37003 RepID=A0A3Q3FQF9_KRYMA|nr:tuftelin 1b [Kryptolebias marmoratus]
MSGAARRPEGNKNGEEDKKSNEHHRQLGLPRKDPDQSGSAGKEPKGAAGLITSTEEEVEVIKVYLETRPETTQSARMLTDEVSQIQEVRYCLKTLREQMAARQNSNNNKYPANGFRASPPISQSAVSNINIPSDNQLGDNQEESARLREATRRLYAQLKEMETRHQEERARLEAESKEYRSRLEEQSERLQAAERQAEEKNEQVEELQRLLGNMVIESGLLKDKMAAGEVELEQLKADREDGAGNEERCAELEKEVALLKEKIHHLDDMLKSQQRKMRTMIEQLQNSRIVLQDRDRVIGDLKERVAFLDAENKELRDHMEYFLSGQDSPSLSVRNKPEVVYSKRLTPTSPTNKVLPFIKVIEIKS